MIESLCKHYPCPHICSRVEHCPAGQERVHWLWLHRRVESKARHPISRFKRCREAVLYNVFGAEKYPKPTKPINYGSGAMFAFKSSLALLIFALIFALVLGFGFLLNGGSLQPNYEADPNEGPNVEWQYDR